MPEDGDGVANVDGAVSRRVAPEEAGLYALAGAREVVAAGPEGNGVKARVDEPLPDGRPLASLDPVDEASRDAVGIGSCSTLESKYRYRGAAGRECPECHAISAKPSKKEWGGGYYCDAKAGGCGARFKADSEQAKALDGAAQIRQEATDPADSWNTVLKMAGKRSMIDGVIRATASSSMFTQDMDDLMQQERPEPPAPEQPATRTSAKAASGPAKAQAEATPADLLRKTIIKEQGRLGVPAAAMKGYAADVLGGKKWADMNQQELEEMLGWLVSNYDTAATPAEVA